MQQHADIVCGIDFSPDGWHLASAGIRKQAGARPSALRSRTCLYHIAHPQLLLYLFGITSQKPMDRERGCKRGISLADRQRLGAGLQVRLYSLAGGLSRTPAAVAPVDSHRMAAKLSCLSWCRHSGTAARVAVADYDGDLTVVDLTTGHHAAAADGHHGRRCDIRVYR